MWYSRMQQPNKKQMKQKVSQLPKSCGIKPEDVEKLPWLPGGFFLDVRVMNQMILDDWQGDGQEEKKTPALENGET